MKTRLIELVCFSVNPQMSIGVIRDESMDDDLWSDCQREKGQQPARKDLSYGVMTAQVTI